MAYPQKYIWMKVTKDKYELPLIVADTAEELASLAGVTLSAVVHAVNDRREKGRKSQYIRVAK